MNNLNIIIHGLTIGAVLCFSIGKAQTVTPEKEKLISSEVSSVIDQYNQWFGAGRTDLIAQRTYSSPSIRLAPTGPTVMMTTEEVKKHFESILKPLHDDGYARSEWVEKNIRVLNESAVVVSGSFIRYRKDGTKIGHFAGTYFLAGC